MAHSGSMDRSGWSRLQQNLSFEELQQQKDFLQAVSQLHTHPSLLTDQEYRRILTSFETTTDQHREFLSSLMAQPERISFGAFCEVLRQLGSSKIADFLETEIPDQLPPSGSSNRMGGPPASLHTTEVACAAAPREMHITGAKNVIYGSNNQIVTYAAPSKMDSSRSRRFNYIRPIVRELYGRNKELEEALDLLGKDRSPVIILRGIVGIGKSSLGKRICSDYLEIAKGSQPDTPLCFMVQFTTDTSSSEMLYREILIQMFGGEGLGYVGLELDERGFLALLGRFCRQLPANCIVLMDDCENIIPTSSLKMIPVLTKALQKMMECSDNLKVVLVSRIDVSLHDLPQHKFDLPELGPEAAVQVLEESGIKPLPSQVKLRQIAVHSYCHPLLLGMALQLLPILGANLFLREISHHASTQVAIKESEAIRRLKEFFLHLRTYPDEFTSFLEVAIIPGKFSLDDWEPEGPTRCALQRRLLLEESRTEDETSYWRVPPVLRQVATEEREKSPEGDRKAKERFAKYCSKLMRRLSSRLYTEMRSVLRELDVQRVNVQLLLNCVSDWKEDFKASPDLFSDVLQSLTYPGIGYMLSLRFNLQMRKKTFETLSAMATKESLAKVYLELCHITRMMSKDNDQSLALGYAEKAIDLFGGDDAPDVYKAQCLAVTGRILASVYSQDTSSKQTAVKILQTARELCEKTRDDTSETDRETYLTYTELLSSVWKALASAYGLKKEYTGALECLETAITLRSEVFGANHISQAILLKETGMSQSKLACQMDDSAVSRKKELFDVSAANLRKAIAIYKEHGCQGHCLYGSTNLALGRTLNNCKMFSEALEALEEACSVFEKLGSECYHRLAQAYSSIGIVYKRKEDTENEITWHKKCLKLLDESRREERWLMQSSWRNLAKAYNRKKDYKNCNHCREMVNHIQSLLDDQ